jgi:AraC-like DNA-binding protein
MTKALAKPKPKNEPGKAGRPKAPLDTEHIKALAGAGCTVEEMAEFLGVNKKTLERRFSAVIDSGRLRRNVSLRRKQMELAMRGDKTMLIWLGKQLLGQSDRSQITGKDDGPVRHEHSLAHLTDEQLEAEIAKLSAAETVGVKAASDAGASETA